MSRLINVLLPTPECPESTWMPLANSAFKSSIPSPDSALTSSQSYPTFLYTSANSSAIARSSALSASTLLSTMVVGMP